MADPSLRATMKYPNVGTLLIFDPTNEKTPFGEIGGYLQANYSLVATPSGADLVPLPQLPANMSGRERTGKFTMTESGALHGEVKEVCVGDSAFYSRYQYIAAEKPTDKVKPVENLLGDSLSTFHVGSVSVSNADNNRQPFIWNYSFQADNYAKFAGNLLLVRPRVLGRRANPVLETSEPRRYGIEFEVPELDTDDFEITMPARYVADDLPPAVDADFGFASYHSKTEVVGNKIHYHRTLEVKQLSVPLSRAPELKKFYRIIASDERNTAVLKLATQ
jgi:hypothetical protein